MKVFLRNTRRSGALCAALLLFSASTLAMTQSPQHLLPIKPDDPNNTTPPAAARNKSAFWPSLRADFCAWPERILIDANYTFLQKNNLWALLLAGGGSIALHQTGADKNLESHFTEHRVLNGFIDETFNILGSPGTHFAVTGLWYGMSIGNGDQLNKERAWTTMTALAITGLTTVGLKAIVNNDTPNSGSWAWPSGHTSSSFTLAAVLDEFYGPKFGIPAYVFAGFVGFRMMDAGDHWPSDVLFGAALGWVVGHSVAGKHRQLELAGFSVRPYPTASGKGLGLSLVRQF